MKNKLSSALILLMMSWGTATAASIDGSQPLLCASTTVIECLPIKGCRQVAPQAVAAPPFIRIDFLEKMLTTPGTNGKSSAIERSETVDGKLTIRWPLQLSSGES